MQSQFEHFPDLPQELQVVTAGYLATPDLAHCAQISKKQYTLFQPLLPVRDFLNGVTRGDHDAVRAILQKNPQLMHQRGRVTDYSARTFPSVSGFEYALWARDKYMWTTMMACIPHNEEGKKISAQLLTQYREVKTEGIPYSLHGTTITESHFDLENTLIKALRTQYNYLEFMINSKVGSQYVKLEPGYTQDEKNWAPIEEQWRVGVGGAQKLLPLHIVHEYCSKKSFFPSAQFNIQPPSSTKVYNQRTKEYHDWFQLKLGVSLEDTVGKCETIAECGISPNGMGHWGGNRLTWARFGLNAMEKLWALRTQDFIELQGHLEHAVTQEPQQTPPI